MEEWKDGRVEEWKRGRVEEGKSLNQDLQDLQDKSLNKDLYSPVGTICL